MEGWRRVVVPLGAHGRLSRLEPMGRSRVMQGFNAVHADDLVVAMATKIKERAGTDGAAFATGNGISERYCHTGC